MAELKEARVPDIGGYGDVPVIEVLVSAGDTVAADQSLVTLESDKATMEVPAPFAGIVREVKVKIGDTLSEGGLVAMIEVEPADAAGDSDGDNKTDAKTDAKTDPKTEAKTEAKTDAPQVQAKDEDKPADADADATPAGNKSDQRADDQDGSDDEAPTRQTTPSQLGKSPGPSHPPVRFDANAVLPDKVPYASPAVRLFARELGVDLAQVTGSERDGRIGKQDVRDFVKSSLHGGGGAAGAGVAGNGGGLDLLPWPKVDFAKFGDIETRELTRIQKLSGANLSRNWAMIPHVTQHDDADITELEALRVALNSENQKKKDVAKLTMLAFLIKASVSALQQYPDFNASLDADGKTLVLKKYIHIGFAADTPNGLVVPVIRDCDRKGVMEIAHESSELAAKAREGKLGPAQMQGGCFTISSLGGIGGTSFTPIVNAPEVAILGVSKAAMQPVWNGERFKPRLLLPLSLSYDHRVIDGAAAARFTAYLAQLLGDLRRALL